MNPIATTIELMLLNGKNICGTVAATLLATPKETPVEKGGVIASQ